MKSAGRGANLLLNIPPDRRGLINQNDSLSLVAFKKLRAESFNKSIITKQLKQPSSEYKLGLNQSQKINCVILKEDVAKGQKVAKFTVQFQQKNKTVHEIQATTVDKKRILTFPTIEADALIIKIDEAKSTPLVNEISVYNIDETLIEQP